MKLLLFTFFLAFIQTYQSAVALTVNVNCRPPKAGTYTLGWGTSRLIIPQNGRPYTFFRVEKKYIKGTLCQSGDNSGVVLFRPDGTVWSYVRSNE